MIRPSQVFLAVAPADMRWGIDQLSLLVQQTDGRSPCDGTAYGFTNRTHSRIKLLIWDGTGVWLCHRRLHKGSFRWPGPGETLFQMSAEQWRWLTAGVDWQRLCAKPADSTAFCHPIQRDSATCSTSILPGQSERSDARFSG